MIVDEVYKTLKQKNLYAKKQYGQNFLMDKNVLNKIIDISNITKDDIVIEIGPGMGCLTEYLCLNAKEVICYEVDKDMVSVLNDTIMKLYNNVTIINEDFLKVDLSNYNTEEKCLNVKVVANLPYYITTPIIFKLLSETKINQYTFMVQKEVGERLTGKPNTKDYNALSVVMQLKTNSKIAYKVSPNSFYPAPKVDSVLLSVKTIKNDYEGNLEAIFIKFVQNIFEQRRKTIINNISDKYGLNKQQLIELFTKNNININLRSESLDLDEIKQLFDLIMSEQKKKK